MDARATRRPETRSTTGCHPPACDREEQSHVSPAVVPRLHSQPHREHPRAPGQRGREPFRRDPSSPVPLHAPPRAGRCRGWISDVGDRTEFGRGRRRRRDRRDAAPLLDAAPRRAAWTARRADRTKPPRRGGRRIAGRLAALRARRDRPHRRPRRRRRCPRARACRRRGATSARRRPPDRLLRPDRALRRDLEPVARTGLRPRLRGRAGGPVHRLARRTRRPRTRARRRCAPLRRARRRQDQSVGCPTGRRDALGARAARRRVAGDRIRSRHRPVARARVRSCGRPLLIDRCARTAKTRTGLPAMTTRAGVRRDEAR